MPMFARFHVDENGSKLRAGREQDCKAEVRLPG